eukprot:RCo044747
MELSSAETAVSSSSSSSSSSSAPPAPTSTDGSSNPGGSSETSSAKKPTVCLVIGMAGSGKTTLMRLVANHFQQQQQQPQGSGRRPASAYVLNLDPAVLQLGYEVNIDIRDTVNYKQVMKQYKLGPNGAIVTALNLFATRFDQVITFIEQKQEEVEYVFIDTPGQIEVFTWSASGQLITEALASTFPTVVLYVVDTVRSTAPATFMANMTYACSIMYKTQLPLLLVLNKTDVVSPDFALRWMTDCDAFAEALTADSSYSASLNRSLSLMLGEFYQTLQCVKLSAATGAGLESLFEALQRSREEYYRSFYPAMLAS